MNRETHNMLSRLERMGISTDDALALRRISMTLHRWHELECGDSNDFSSWGIERDETTGKPFMVSRPHTSNKVFRHSIADRETGALKRLDKLMERYPELAAYVQGDPRGAALYVYRKDAPMLADCSIESVYSSIGCAIYK